MKNKIQNKTAQRSRSIRKAGSLLEPWRGLALNYDPEARRLVYIRKRTSKKAYVPWGYGVDQTDPRYNIWRSMLNRCHYPKDKKYRWYGAKGISVCHRWQRPVGYGFRNFCEDMGIRQTMEMIIDRINFDGNYEPNNCRWLHKSQNIKRVKQW